MTHLNHRLVYLARFITGTHNSIPIEIDPAATGLQMDGESYHWTTLGGRPIRHPGAYHWPKLYVASTRRLRVEPAFFDRAKISEVRSIDGTPTVLAFAHRYEPGRTVRVTAGWTRGRKVFVVGDGARTVHVTRRGPLADITTADYEAALTAARAAWAAQDEADRLARVERQRLASVWVSAPDSIRAGNCVPGMEHMAAILARSLRAQGELGAIRADVLLLARDDVFTRRAITAAAARGSFERTQH